MVNCLHYHFEYASGNPLEEGCLDTSDGLLIKGAGASLPWVKLIFLLFCRHCMIPMGLVLPHDYNNVYAGLE